MGNEREWLSAGGITIDAAAVLLDLKVGAADSFLHKLVIRKIAAAMAAAKGIVVSDRETEAALAAFYSDHRLFEQEQIDEWHRSVPIEPSALRDFIHEHILQRRLEEVLAPDDVVLERFGSNPHDYARAEVNVFTFETEGAADEFILAVREQEVQPFGNRVHLFRRDAPPEVAAELYSAQTGDLVGPVESDDRRFRVYRLLHRDKPTLDGPLKKILRGEISAELIEAVLARQPRTFLL
jgi:hypothetical protein